MRTITTLPHDIEISQDILKSLNACEDSQLLTPEIAIGRVDDIHWIVCANLGDAMIFVASDHKPSLVEITKHIRREQDNERVH